MDALESEPLAVLERLRAAMNRRDLNGFLHCFHDNYRSEQPLHPERTFAGREQVGKNWASIFAEIKDFQAETLRQAVSKDVVWSEWRWGGTKADGQAFLMGGVTIFGVEADRIAWGRLYMKPIEAGPAMQG